MRREFPVRHEADRHFPPASTGFALSPRRFRPRFLQLPNIPEKIDRCRSRE